LPKILTQALAADLPASIIADLLGMHINTAIRWIDYAGRDWTDYLAARAVESLPISDAVQTHPTVAEAGLQMSVPGVALLVTLIRADPIEQSPPSDIHVCTCCRYTVVVSVPGLIMPLTRPLRSSPDARAGVRPGGCSQL